MAESISSLSLYLSKEKTETFIMADISNGQLPIILKNILNSLLSHGIKDWLTNYISARITFVAFQNTNTGKEFPPFDSGFEFTLHWRLRLSSKRLLLL